MLSTVLRIEFLADVASVDQQLDGAPHRLVSDPLHPSQIGARHRTLAGEQAENRSLVWRQLALAAEVANEPPYRCAQLISE
jgi:hypothetical protein